MTILGFLSGHIWKKFLTLELLGKLMRAFSGSHRHCQILLPQSATCILPPSGGSIYFFTCFSTCSPTLEIINLFLKTNVRWKMVTPFFSIDGIWVNHLLVIYISISLSRKLLFISSPPSSMGSWFIICLWIWTGPQLRHWLYIFSQFVYTYVISCNV